MDAATTLAAVKAAGGTFGLSDEGQLVIDFGEAEVEESLLEALHAHAAIFRSLLGAKPSAPAGPEPVPFEAGATDAAPEPSAEQLPPPAPAPPPAGELLDHVTVAGNVAPFRVWHPGQLLAGDTIGIDTETEVIDLKDPSLPPPRMVLATATDGSRGFYVSPADIADFIKAHPRACFVMHNAPFDTEVIDQATAGRGVMLPLYDANRVADTMQMERLLELASSGEVPQFVSLDKLARKYLGVPVEKQLTDASGTDIRTGFGRYLGQPLEVIPAASRTYAASDTVATWMVWQHQKAVLRHIKGQAPLAYGFTTEQALEAAWAEYGPLSLHVQVKAAMLCKVLWRRGLHIDQARREEVQKQLRRLEESAALKLGMADIYVPRDGEKLPKGVPSVQTAMRRHIEAIEEKLLADGTIAAPLPRTETGKLKMDAEQQRAWVEQGFDEVVTAYGEYCRAKKYQSTYCTKMAREQVHPSWRNLKVSGRFSCVGELAVQTLPKCGNSPTEMSLRRCIVPAAGHLFVIVDFAQLEVVALAAALEHQLHYGQALADVIRAGQDVHSAIAVQMFPGRIGPVSSQERKRVKPITFGLPAGMGAAAIQRNAKASYGVELTVEQVEGIIFAYKSLAPELVQHLAKTRDPGISAMRACGLKSKWQGWQLLRLLGGDATHNGNPLPAEEVERLWVTAEQLKPLLPAKSATQRRYVKALEERKPSPGLAAAVRRALTPQASLNMSGRLRANCSFTEARNNIFQSIAADGAIHACWRLFRLGYDIRLFLHDEIVTQVPDDGRHDEHVKIISEVMIGEMSKALKGLPVSVEAVVSRSFSDRDKVVNGFEADGKPRQLRQGLPVKAAKPRSPKGLKLNKPAIDPSWLPEGDLPF